MKPTSPAPTNHKAPASAPAGKRALVPPDEQFWVRYSPHHEFPLSGVATVTLYGVLGALLLVVWLYGDKWFGVEEALPVEPIAFAGNPGGGGDGDGDGSGPPAREEDVAKYDDTAETLPDALKPKVALTDLKRPVVKPEEFTEFDPKDVDALRYIEKANIAAASLSKVKSDARAKLMEGLKGSGSGGGKDGGKDVGKDKGTGPNVPGGPLNDRQKRVLRWAMNFDTVNGEDYRRQLHAMGAILAFPTPKGYFVVRDLSRKAAGGQIEDVAQIKRIYWVDGQPQSVKQLSMAIGLPSAPEHIVAFFPEKLEAELLRKEKKFAGREEHEIQETRFRVVRRGATYEPIVVDQR